VTPPGGTGVDHSGVLSLQLPSGEWADYYMVGSTSTLLLCLCALCRGRVRGSERAVTAAVVAPAGCIDACVADAPT
jgi:hypothetical protein